MNRKNFLHLKNCNKLKPLILSVSFITKRKAQTFSITTGSLQKFYLGQGQVEIINLGHCLGCDLS